jgi:hypothetical protein
MALLHGELFLKDHRRSADSLSLEIDGHLYVVGDLDERNAAVHAVLLPVENHDNQHRLHLNSWFRRPWHQLVLLTVIGEFRRMYLFEPKDDVWCGPTDQPIPTVIAASRKSQVLWSE